MRLGGGCWAVRWPAVWNHPREHRLRQGENKIVFKNDMHIYYFRRSFLLCSHCLLSLVLRSFNDRLSCVFKDAFFTSVHLCPLFSFHPLFSLQPLFSFHPRRMPQMTRSRRQLEQQPHTILLRAFQRDITLRSELLVALEQHLTLYNLRTPCNLFTWIPPQLHIFLHRILDSKSNQILLSQLICLRMRIMKWVLIMIVCISHSPGRWERVSAVRWSEGSCGSGPVPC